MGSKFNYRKRLLQKKKRKFDFDNFIIEHFFSSVFNLLINLNQWKNTPKVHYNNQPMF